MVRSDTVLVGFADAVAAPEATWSLLDAGFRVVAFGRAGRRSALHHLRGVEVVPVTAPEVDAHRAVEDVIRLAAQVDARAVLPLDDAAVWTIDAAQERIEAPVVGPTGELAALALDKRVQLVGAELCGLSVPPTVTCRTRDQVAALPDEPLILRPALAIREHEGRLVRDRVLRCADAGELARAAESWDEASPLLAQPLIAGRGEGIFGLAGRDGFVHWSAHRRMRMVDPRGSGSSACRSAAPERRLVDGAHDLLGGAGWRGLFMVEYLRDAQGRAWFVELNGRCWGSLALARRLGLEYPAWAVADRLGDPVPARAPRSPRAAGDELVCRHLGREIVHLLNVLRGPVRGDASGWPSRWATLRDVVSVRPGERWYNWRRDAPSVFLHDTLDTLLEAAGRGRR
jgi:hypothetical protein